MVTSVSSAFEILHSRQRLTDAQTNVATGRISGLRSYFARNYEMAEPVFPVGSYSRLTICDRERDIDLMAPLRPHGQSDYWDRFRDDSRDFLYWIRRGLNEQYYATKVSSRQVCVKLDFTNIVTDVIPCFPRNGGGYLMPDGHSGWMSTNPPFHSDLMSRADNDHLGKLKPLIRLIKWWNIANGSRLRSFHLELMTEQIQRGYSIGIYSYEVAFTLGALASLVERAVYDPWPHGVQVDGYLSDNERGLVARLLRSDEERARQAEEYRKSGKTQQAFEQWSVVYNHTFPSYG